MKKTACIIASGEWDGKRALLKNRDRNYTPRVTLVRDIIDGTEVLYMRDDVTGWCEGMNEHGIGIVNAALAVGIDEKEGKFVQVTGKTTRDGQRILKALSYSNMGDVVQSICSFMKGLRGHTFISTPEKAVCVEQTKEYECKVRDLSRDDVQVRTNHGFYHSGAGYTEGENYVSSVIRRERALQVLRDAESPSELGPSLMRKRMKNRTDPNNMVRDTGRMSTVSQMVLNLTDLEMLFYVIPGKMDYEGLENRLPEDYKPKIKLKVMGYRSGGTELVELSVKTGLRKKSKEPLKLASRVASRYLEAAVPEKYKHIDFKPPQAVAEAAAKGLEYRQKASPSNKGGLTPAEAAKQGIGSGVQRAVNLKNRDNISPDVIKQMAAFFSRHQKNKGVSPEHKSEPWNDKGNVSWLIWGGDPGWTWAEKIKKQMETADEKAKKASSLKPASPSQISYAKALIEQGLKGLPGSRRGPAVPPWLNPEDVPTDAQLGAMDAVAISTLIDALKSRKPFKVDRYGGGAYKVVLKGASSLARRVAARYFEARDLELSHYGLEGLSEGKPVTLYHGTAATFSEFDMAKNRDELVNKFYGRGLFFTPSKKVAWRYAEAPRNMGLPASVIDDLKSVNRNAGNFLQALYDQGQDAWEPYWKAHGFWREIPPPGEGNLDWEGFERHLGGVDGHDLMDVSDHIIGAARKQSPPDELQEIMNIFHGGASGTPDWVYNKLDSIGIDSTKYRPKVLTVSVTASNPLITKSKTEARKAASKGYDSVVYYGSDLVEGFPEVVVFDPRKVRITKVET